MAVYNYKRVRNIDDANDVSDAISITIINYMHHQLGWSLQKCEKRVEKELNRVIPKGCFDMLENSRGWDLEDSKLLDVGCGQGGAVLEALMRGANAYGVEPGPEFAKLSQMRIKKSGYNPDIIKEEEAEKLSFEDNSFDYVISLQVLEHVENPEPILKEIYRVLKPGGECWISCENYLAFREQHYRINWFPLLPKWIGSIYLRMKGRDPNFLNNYVYYTTYSQIWRLCNKVGFNNITYDCIYDKIQNYRLIENKNKRRVAKLFSYLPVAVGKRALKILLHARNFMGVGVRVLLKKNESSYN